MCSMRAFIAALALLLGCAPGARAEARKTAEADTLTLRSVGDQEVLEVHGAATPFHPGRAYVVRVANLDGDRPGWRFELGGVGLAGVGSSTHPTFLLPAGSEVQPLSGKVDLKLVASSGTLSLRPETLELAVDAAAGGAQVDRTAGWNDASSLPNSTVYDRRRNRITLVFDGDGLPIGEMPTDVDDNDIIQATIVLTDDEQGSIGDYSVTVTGKFASGGYPVLASGAGPIGGRLTGTTSDARGETLRVYNMGTYGPFSAGSLEIKITPAKAELRDYKIRVSPNYLAAFRFGVGQSPIRFNDFYVAPRSGASGDTGTVMNHAAPDGEPRSYLAVVFYSWQIWRDRFWNGRDLDERPEFLDRINPFLGVGVKDLGKEYLFGVTAEVARGLDVVWAVQYARVPELDGSVREGDTFVGKTGDLPIRYRWRTSSGFWGVSVDLRIAVGVFKSVIGN